MQAVKHSVLRPGFSTSIQGDDSDEDGSKQPVPAHPPDKAVQHADVHVVRKFWHDGISELSLKFSKLLAKDDPLKGGVERASSFEAFLKFKLGDVRKWDVWIAFLCEAKEMPLDKLKARYSPEYSQDCERQSYRFDERLFSCGENARDRLAAIDALLLAKLAILGIRDERTLHIYRYLFQDLMHQRLYNFDEKFIASCISRYFEKDLILSGFGHNNGLLKSSGRVDCMSFKASEGKAVLTAMQYWQVLPKGAKEMTPIGFDALKIELVFDFHKVISGQYLLSPDCCKARLRFHGFRQKLDEINL